jgi:hypothetical protein
MTAINPTLTIQKSPSLTILRILKIQGNLKDLVRTLINLVEASLRKILRNLRRTPLAMTSIP